MKRKQRPGEINCTCGAYSFPHRQMGGKCDGGAFVERFFTDNMFSECRDCHFLAVDEESGERSCEVLEGRDKLTHCPALADHIRYNGIKIYGVNK